MTTTTQLVPAQTVPDIDPEQLFYVLYSPTNPTSVMGYRFGVYAWTAKEIVSLLKDKLARADYNVVDILRARNMVDLINYSYDGSDDAEYLLRQPTFSEEFAAAVYDMGNGDGEFWYFKSAEQFVDYAALEGLRDDAEDLVATYDHRVNPR